jgi:Smg protein
VFDILTYLVERYFDLGAYPDLETLSRQLAAAGFESDDIDQAVHWLSGLAEASPAVVRGTRSLHPAGALRHYAAAESRKIAREGRGFLHFLENAGVLEPEQREVVIDRIMALDEPEVGVEQVKLIVLMVLWNQGEALDSLVVDELLASERTLRCTTQIRGDSGPAATPATHRLRIARRRPKRAKPYALCISCAIERADTTARW